MKTTDSPLQTSAQTSYLTSELTPSQKRQLEREKQQRDYFLGRRKKTTQQNYSSGRGSQNDGSRGLRYLLVPKIAEWVEKHAAKQTANGVSRAGYAVKEFLRLRSWVDAETTAHITLSVILDMLGSGATIKTGVTAVNIAIGEQLEHQAFIAYMEEADPAYFKKLERWYLNDPVRTYKKKIEAMVHSHNKHEEMDWKWMSTEEKLHLGSLLLKAVISIRIDQETGEGLFEARPPVWNDPNKKQRRQKVHQESLYLGFTKAGLKYRDMLQRLADEDVMKATPMVCEPLDWSLTERGGYLTHINRDAAELIHGNTGSQPSQIVLDALNRLQKTPFRINKYILELQEELLRKTWEIGSFRTYEKDSWTDENFPLFDSAWLAMLDTDSDEYKQAMRKLTEAYHNQKIDEQKSEPPRRTWLQAKELENEERVYFAWFLDRRGRLYPLASGISPQGADYSKALLMSADGVEINEDTRRDLLINIATAGDFDGVSKKDFFQRMMWAEKFTSTEAFKAMVEDPNTHQQWMEADEPFCFLALCHEFYRVFITGEQHKVFVFFGKDATCSGVQILSAVIKDEKAARFTNVLVTEEPQDLYGEVAKEAQKLMRSKPWMDVQLEKQEAKRLAHNSKIKEDSKTKRWDERRTCDVDPSVHDRAVNKTQAMTCGYGATLRTRYNNIKEALAKKVKKGVIPEIHPADANIVCAAGIDGMTQAFPAYMELNKWFKKFATAALNAGCEQITWTSPSGMFVSQEYRQPLYKDVYTYAAGGGHYGTLGVSDEGHTIIEHGYGDPKLSKNQSAIAANWTHSLDGAVMALGVLDVPAGIPVYTCHDCVYCLAGQFGSVIPHFRKAFHNVVTSPVLEEMLESNGLTDVVPLPPIGDLNIDEVLESPYLFC
jgi:DNA-directed RNA polymerase, mitochondrial